MKTMRAFLSISLSSLLLFTSLSACQTMKTENARGYAPEKLEELNTQLKPGLTTQDTVRNLIGSPSTISNFGKTTWYYIGYETSTVAFLTPDITKQDVLALEFDDQGILSDSHHYTKKDIRDVAFKTDHTPTEGDNLTVIQQLLGNVGRFNKQEEHP